MLYLLVSGLFYILGVLLTNEIINSFTVKLLITIIIPILITLLSIKLRKIGIIASISLVSLLVGSFWHYSNIKKPNNNDLFYYEYLKNIELEGTIISEPKIKKGKVVFDFKSNFILKPHFFHSKSKSKITVYTDNNNLEYGDQIKIKGSIKKPPEADNPNLFSYSKYLKRQGVFSLITVNSSKDIKIIKKGTINDWKKFIINSKEQLLKNFYRNISEEYVGFISSLVIGSKSINIDQKTQEDFNSLGLAHILAASGMQVSLILFLGLLLIEKTNINEIIGIIITALVIIFYMFLTDLPPSIVRAGLVSLFVLIFSYKNLKTDSLKILIFVGYLILIISPNTIFDVGFQFSMLATFALLYCSKIISEKLVFMPNFLAQSVAVIISAQMFVLPLQIFHFSQFSYMFLIANIIATFFVSFLTYLAIAIIFLGFIPILGKITGLIISFVTYIFISIIEKLTIFESIIDISKPSILTVIISYLIIFIFIEIIKFEKDKKIVIPLIILLSGLSIYKSILYWENRNILKIHYINVSQGDSTLIQTAQGKNILIDCGNAYSFKKDKKEFKFNAAERYLKPYFKILGINTIDLLIVTHPDSDHVGGCNSILENYQVKEIWDSGQSDDSLIYNSFLHKVLEKKINFKSVNQGESYKENKLSLKVINKTNTIYQNSTNNNNSIVIRLDYKNNSFLFTGDLEKEGESELISQNLNLDIDVLKVGHHGSKTSSSLEFLGLTRSKYSIISSGKNNRFGHPNYEVLENLNIFGSKIYRTDTKGGIIINSNGYKYNIITAH